MNTLREAMSGFLSIIAVTILVLGAMTMALAENGLVSSIELPKIGFSSPVTDLPGRLTILPHTIRNPKIITLTPATFVCRIPKGWQTYLIQTGDNLFDLASSRAIAPKTLMEGNCLVGSTLPVGTTLFLPPPLLHQTPTALVSTQIATLTPQRCGSPRGWVRYVVLPNDTLFKLSIFFGVSIPDLQFANCLTSTLIRSGDFLYVPNVPTRIPSPTIVPSFTQLPPTLTRTSAFTSTKSSTVTSTPTRMVTTTRTRTVTNTPTSTFTPTVTLTKTATPTPSVTASNTATNTLSPSKAP